MYSVGRHSRKSSSSRNRTGKPYAAHLARYDYLLIYLPTQVQLTLTKITKIVATRWRILRLKCTKFDFGWGSVPDSAGGACIAPPDSLARFGGLLLRGGDGRGKEKAMSPQYLEEVYAYGANSRTWQNGKTAWCSHYISTSRDPETAALELWQIIAWIGERWTNENGSHSSLPSCRPSCRETATAAEAWRFPSRDRCFWRHAAPIGYLASLLPGKHCSQSWSLFCRVQIER